MRVLNYLELEGRLDRSGIGTAAAQQRAALEAAGVEVVTDPWRAGVPPVEPFDLAHVNLFGPGTLAVAAAARRRGAPLVAHAHVTAEDFRGSFRGSDLAAGPLRRYLRWFYSRADRVLCPSEYTRGTLAEYPIDAPVEPVSNGVDLDSLAGFEALREPYRERFDLDGLVAFAPSGTSSSARASRPSAGSPRPPTTSSPGSAPTTPAPRPARPSGGGRATRRRT